MIVVQMDGLRERRKSMPRFAMNVNPAVLDRPEDRRSA
jgi:hypothetical protein